MKSVLSIKSILFSFFLLFFSLSINSQVGGFEKSGNNPLASLGTIVTNGGDIDPVNYFVELGCPEDFSVSAIIVLDNLEAIPLANGWMDRVLPPNTPDMYVVFTIDNIILDPIYIPGFSFEPGNNLSYCTVTSPYVRLSEQCDENGPFIDIVASAKLVTHNGNDWVDYPACSHLDIFSCYAYPSAPWCPGADPSGECFDEYFSVTQDIRLECCRLTDDGIPGDRNIDNETEISIFPNPIQDYVNVCIGNTKNTSHIEIYDSSNKLVLKTTIDGQNQDEVQINTSKFSSGLYTIKIINDDTITSRRLIKN